MTDNKHSTKNMTEAKAPLLERVLFGKRLLVLVLFAVFTAIMGFQASNLRMEASFENDSISFISYFPVSIKSTSMRK